MKTLLFLTVVTMFMSLIGCQAAQSEPAAGLPAPSASQEPEPVSGEVQANGITIAYESFGSAQDETILLIAGTGQQLVGWPLALVDALVEGGYRVIRFDNRDVGLSTKLAGAGLPDPQAVSNALQEGKPPPVPYTLRDMAQDAAGLLDALSIERAHIVGVSMGGAIAQWLAIDHPDRVLSLTSIAADSGNSEIPVIANPAAFVHVPPQPTTMDRDAFITWQVKTSQALAGSTYATDEATLREWAARDFERGFDPDGLVRQQTASLVGHFENPPYRLNHLETILAPTVVVQGTEDPIVAVASAEDIVARVPNAEMRIIPGLGHFIPEALIPEIAAVILETAGRADDISAGMPSQVEDELRATIWQLDSFGPPEAAAPVVAESTITLEFAAGAQVSGHGGCNSYRGTYALQGDGLVFEEIVSTLIACPEEAVNVQEQQYLQALRTAGRFTLAGDRLTIWYDDEQGALHFRPLSTPTPQPVEGTPQGKSGERILFPADGTSVEIFAELAAGVTDSYVVQAEQGKIMSVAIASPNTDVMLGVLGEDGTPLKRYEDGAPSWASQVPATQDYTLQAVSVGSDTSYTMRIWIEPVAEQIRERVVFESGENVATRSGALADSGVKEYVLSLTAGQRLHVQTVGYNAPVAFTVTGPDGDAWPGEQGASDVHIFTAQVILPQDGDYVVALAVPPDAGATRFEVAFTVDPDPRAATAPATEPPDGNE